MLWHEKLIIILKKLEFLPCKSEPDIWMRKSHNIYEYIAVYVDDLDMCAKNPKEIIDVLENVYKFKLRAQNLSGIIWVAISSKTN